MTLSTRSLVVVLALAAGCSKDERIPLVVYSPHGEDILKEFEVAFETLRPDVDVRGFGMSSYDCLDRIRGESAHPNCDVWWGAASNTFARAAGDGLLEPFRPSWADALSADMHDPQWNFAAEFVLPYVFVFNDQVVTTEQAPSDWDDLASDAWADRVVLRIPMKSGLRTVLASLVDWKAKGGDPKPGFDFLAAMHRNTRRYVNDPSELFQAVTQEDGGVVTIWNLTDALFQRDRYKYPFGWKLPKSGAPILKDCIALVKKERDPAAAAAAREFYEFVTSLDSLRKLMREHFRLPARTDVPEAMRPEWQQGLVVTPLPVDAARVAANEEEWMRRWDEQVKPLPRGKDGKR